MERYAVIDLGTNTFHLLIVAITGQGSFSEIYRERHFVKLGESGLEKIGENAFRRGLTTLRAFAATIRQHDVRQVRAFGTAALRTASNGMQFIEEVAADTGIIVELISGEKEAQLIHRGVASAIPFGAERRLIMDIGGGSVEFIIANGDQVFWAESFPVGLAVLYRNFHQEDPITAREMEALQAFLDDQLSPLMEALAVYPVRQLVGASGIFDVLETLLVKTKDHPLFSYLPAASLLPLFERVIPTSLAERLEMEEVPPERADMIVVAFLLIDFMIQRSGIDTILVSAYAMKEGMLYEMARETTETEKQKNRGM